MILPMCQTHQSPYLREAHGLSEKQFKHHYKYFTKEFSFFVLLIVVHRVRTLLVVIGWLLKASPVFSDGNVATT